MLQNALVQLGLSEREASAYIMLVRIGTSPVSTLAKRLSAKRVTLYAVLESLERRAYVAFQRRGSCRYYTALDPECILDDLNRKNEALSLQLNLARTCVKKLQSLPLPQKNYFKSSELFLGAEAEERLMRALDKNTEAYVFSLNSELSNPMERILQTFKNWKTEVHRQVLSESFSGATVGSLIVQGGKVIFLSLEEEELQVSIQVDSLYANLLIHLFNSSHLDRSLTS
ncbi:MAG: sugar-specific transcriptional regulator TrmB [Oceanicoccus sp.]|jgi:sugar-specific transcriptional regulator TrmB